MQENTSPRNSKIIISEGLKFGILTVGPLVRWVREHPLYHLTAPSYLTHGRLRECFCECGDIKLYSECALSTQNIKSCGCLKKKRIEESVKAKLAREERNSRKREINHRIRQAQIKLKLLQGQPVFMRDTPQAIEAMDAISVELRKLYAMKSYANRKA